MSYQDAMDAINLKMPRRIPRTEYSASSYWKFHIRKNAEGRQKNTFNR